MEAREATNAYDAYFKTSKQMSINDAILAQYSLGLSRSTKIKQTNIM